MSEAAPLLGVFGGTFDPLHLGHLRLAQEAYEAFGLRSVRFIPAGQPRHRDVPGASATDRLAMVERALANLAHFSVDAAEVLSDQPSYTVPTLERLRRELGEGLPLVLILGADAFAGLARWHRWQEIFGLAHIAVATRPGHVLQVDALEAPLAAACVGRLREVPQALHAATAGLVVPFTMTPLAISATAIRELLRTGHSPRFLVPDTVLDYIEGRSLYFRIT